MSSEVQRALWVAGVLIMSVAADVCHAENVAIAAGPLRVGIATADITPEGSVWMEGFAARKKPSEGVYKPLTASCVVFDNTVTRLAFVALDLCKIEETPQLADLRAAAQASGIPPQHVMINFSHTHSGPELGRAVVVALAVPGPVPATRPQATPEAVNAPVQLGGIVEAINVPDRRQPDSKSHRIYTGAWRVGDVYFFGSQCELGVKIGLRIKREFAGLRVWTNGYTHWGIGYILDAASYPEGGDTRSRTATSVRPRKTSLSVMPSAMFARWRRARQGKGRFRNRRASDMPIH